MRYAYKCSHVKLIQHGDKSCCTWICALNNKSLSPPPDDAQAQALAGPLEELHGERVPQIFLLVLGLVPVDHQPNLLWGLPQHIDGLVVTRLAQVDTVHLWRGGEKKGCPIAATVFKRKKRPISKLHWTVLKISATTLRIRMKFIKTRMCYSFQVNTTDGKKC